MLQLKISVLITHNPWFISVSDSLTVLLCKAYSKINEMRTGI